MKKTIRNIALFLICIMAFSFSFACSCNDEENPIDNPETESNAEITLDKTELVIDVLTSETITASVKYTLNVVEWSSSDAETVSVDSNGKVTGKKVGSAVITATVNGKSATCKVTVEDRGSIAYIKFNNFDDQVNKFVGDEFTVQAEIIFNGESTGNAVTAVSSDETVLKIENGKFKALKIGVATITFSGEFGGKAVKKTATVNVISTPSV